MTEIVYTSMPCPFGELWIAAGTDGIVAAAFGVDELRFTTSLPSWADPYHDPEGLPGIRAQFDGYFAGTLRSFDAPLDLSTRGPFQRAVLEAVAAVPYGEVASYGDIARAIGHPRAARAVGNAVGVNPITILVPCHRIILSDGTLGEYGAYAGLDGVRLKQALLRREGLEIPYIPRGNRLARGGERTGSEKGGMRW